VISKKLRAQGLTDDFTVFCNGILCFVVPEWQESCVFHSIARATGFFGGGCWGGLLWYVNTKVKTGN